MCLTHWGRVTHICVGNLTTIGSDNGLSPGRRQAITWNNVGILLIGPVGTHLSEILIGIQTFSFQKMHLKMSSAKWRPFVSASLCLTIGMYSTCSCGIIAVYTVSDEDECQASPSPCPAASTCVNTPGAFSCPCQTGYSKVEDVCTGKIVTIFIWYRNLSLLPSVIRWFTPVAARSMSPQKFKCMTHFCSLIDWHVIHLK